MAKRGVNGHEEHSNKKIAIYSDFDGTIITNNTSFFMHVEGFKKQLREHHVKKAVQLLGDGIRYIWKEAFNKDDRKEVIYAAKFLKGLYLPEIFVKLKKQIKINPKLGKAIEEYCKRESIDFSKIKKINVRIISRGDCDLIKLVVPLIEKELMRKYKIKITEIIANEYKKHNGFFTGKMKYAMHSKQQFFNNHYFLGDYQDSIKYRTYKKFIRV